MSLVPRPRSSQADGQVWKECVCWQELDSTQAQMEVTFLSSTPCFLGKMWQEGVACAGREAQSKLFEFWAATTCQRVPTMMSGPHGRGGITNDIHGQALLQDRNTPSWIGSQGRGPGCVLVMGPSRCWVWCSFCSYFQPEDFCSQAGAEIGNKKPNLMI